MEVPFFNAARYNFRFKMINETPDVICLRKLLEQQQSVSFEL
jgi:hypothetical protein